MIRHVTVIAFLAIAVGTTANAEELATWGTSGEWAIHIDPAAGNGCLMEK